MTTPADIQTPTDQAVRERILSALDETLFVEAGAGTGKTTALVGRILALVESGVPITSIAAITFTELAAAELQERVRQQLEERLASGTPHIARCRAALDALDAASIQTLHAFARGILAMFPLEAGLPPGFEVRDDIVSETAFDDRWTSFLAELFGGTSPEPRLTRALALGLTVRQIKAIALKLHSNWDRLEREEIPHQAATLDGIEPILDPLWRAVSVRSICDDPADKLFLHLEALAPYCERLEAAAQSFAAATDPTARSIAEQDLLALLNRKTLTARSVGNGPNWDGNKEDIHDLLKTAELARNEFLNNVRCDCIEFVRAHLVDWVLDYAEERRIDGSLEFQDLLVLAVELLRTNPAVRLRLHNQYTRLLVDEFQDTDPLQVEIATLLATAATDLGTTPWEQLPIEPGRLFFVGDPRQSIYRFRRADIDLYNAARETFVPGAEHLTANFRARPGLIDWTNQVFASLFTQQYGRASELAQQAAYTPLEPSRVDRALHCHVIGEPVAGQNVSQVRATEAAEIARLIRDARENDWLETGPAGRPTRYADMTILLPTRTPLRAFERALGHLGIPFRVEGATLLFDTQEVRDFTNILAAIDDPSDEVAVVAALRSPAFACADDDLYAYRAACPRRTWDYAGEQKDEPPAGNPVTPAMQALREFRARSRESTVPELIETIIRDRHIFELGFAHSRPRDSWQRIRFLHEKARQLAASGGNLRQFVAWLRHQAANDTARFTESAVPDPDDDAVRIMTMHGAKGLEFPIVFVAGLDTGPPTAPPPVLFPPAAMRHATPEVSAGRKGWAFQSRGYERLRPREDLMERLQRDRLLYVAATRARDCLVVSVYHLQHNSLHSKRHGDGNCTLAECLFHTCAADARLAGEPLAASPAAPSPGLPPYEAVDLQARQAWITQRADTIAHIQLPKTVAATAIAHLGEEKREPDDDDSPWRRGRAGTALGRAVHAVLQTIDLVTLENLEAAARAQAAAEGISGRESEIVRRVRAAVASEPVREALRSGRYWRELYVAAPVPGTKQSMLVEGFIDLLYESEGGYVVVDYKTDGVVSDNEIDGAWERYRLQGASYAFALEQAGIQPVRSFVCVFARPVGEASTRELCNDELRAEVVIVRERLDDIERGQLALNSQERSLPDSRPLADQMPA